MTIEKLDSYVLSSWQEKAFFTLSQMIYEVRAVSGVGQTCRQIETYSKEGNIPEGILYKDSKSPSARIIVFPNSSLERFMRKNFGEK